MGDARFVGKRRGGLRAARVVQVIAIGAALVFSLAPLYWMLATSFKTELEAARLAPTLWPHEVTFANYRGLWAGSLPFVDGVWRWRSRVAPSSTCSIVP